MPHQPQNKANINRVQFDENFAEFVSRGFTTVPNIILDGEMLSGRAQLVMIYLLKYAYGYKDHSFPGQATLAKENGCCVRSIGRAIKELQMKGFITVKRRGLNRTNYYILHTKGFFNPEKKLSPKG